MFNSSYSAAVYIAMLLEKRRAEEGKETGREEGLRKETGKEEKKGVEGERKEKVFVIGEAGIEDELRAAGLSVVGGTDPALRRDITPEDYAEIAAAAAAKHPPLFPSPFFPSPFFPFPHDHHHHQIPLWVTRL